MKRLLLFLVTACLLNVGIESAKAQDSYDSSKKIQFILGANVMYEAPWQPLTYSGSDRGLKDGVYYGLSVESRFTRHSGVELNLSLRSRNSAVSIPLMYKFYSKVLNFSAGVSADIPLQQDFRGRTNVEFGFIFRLSKDIKLYKNLFVEPQIHFNGLFLHQDFELGTIWVGMGVGVKYRF